MLASVGASVLRRTIAALIVVDEPGQLGLGATRLGVAGTGARARSSSRRVEQRPDLLVGLDPRRRIARVAKHPVGHRPVAGERCRPRAAAARPGAAGRRRRRAPSPRGSAARRGSPRSGRPGVRRRRRGRWAQHARSVPRPLTGELARRPATVGRVQTIDGRPVYSATDLVAYLACEHLTQLERAALAGLVERPMRDDPELDIIRKRGFEHEARYLADLAGRGPDGGRRSSSTARSRTAATSSAPRPPATIEAMAAGADVIYQATFFDGTWRGHADFLLRVDDPDRPSRWGPWHYEVADTKLARHVKASAVLQICSLRRPARAASRASGRSGCTSRSAAAPGPSSGCGSTTTWPTTAARRRPLPRDDGRPTTPPTYPPAGTYPEPVEHCDVCRWAAECAARRRADDHLSLVAGISARQRRALTERGRPDARGARATCRSRWTRRSRARATARSLRVREQARIQLEGRRERRPQLRAPPARSRATRSSRSAASPRCRRRRRATSSSTSRATRTRFDDGLDYLFGVLETDGTFHAIWSRDDAGEFTLDGERRAFERLMDFFMERLDARPDAARLPLRPVRADRAQAPDGPLRDARGRGRSAAPRRRPRRPAAGRPPVAARLGRELLDQEDGGVLRVRPRDRPARRRARASSPSSSGSSSARASGRRPTTSTGSSATTATTSSATCELRDWLEELPRRARRG